MSKETIGRRGEERSRLAFEEAKQVLPGGVNSPVRAFKSVGLTPMYIEHGSGSRIYDIDGNGFIDYVGSWGPLIMGHAHPEVVRGAPGDGCERDELRCATLLETQMAKLVAERVRRSTWCAW
ncbi:hypothetical protein HMSSN139_17500 [Paenibacillus sp. HMSSN-139]|nr:hypothetical protein HMSSN139_17500 [Paenibacillus sp. HMSSN-139]